MERNPFFKTTGKKNTVRIAAALVITAVMVLSPFMTMANEDMEMVYRVIGPTNNSKLGWNVTIVGDVNNDGNDDYAIGAPGENKVYLFRGPLQSGFTMSGANWIITGPASSNFGWSVAGLGDYNGDNYDDVIIGAPGASKAYIFKGRTTNLVTTVPSNVAITLSGDSGDYFGHSVAGIDYANNSNIFAAVGAPQDNHFLTDFGQFYRTGAVFLFNLSYLNKNAISSADETGTNLTFIGGPNNGWFGFTLINLGDVNYNGNTRNDDLGIGDPYFNVTSEDDNGAFYIQYGKDTIQEFPVIPSYNMNNYIYGYNNSRFGWSAAALGDVSPSPEDDFMVGAPWDDEVSTPPFNPDVGCAYMFYGKQGVFQMKMDRVTNIADVEFWGVQTGDRMGLSMSRADMMFENVYAVAVGAPGYDNGTKAESGAVFMFWDWSPIQNYTLSKSDYFGWNAGDNMGYSISQAYFKSTAWKDLKLVASAPYYGSSNTGAIELLERNVRPTLSSLTVSPPTGNERTDFEIRLGYTDLDGDPPEYVKVHIYQDQAETKWVRTVDLSNPTGLGYDILMNYSTILKLPSSITKEDDEKPLFFRAEVKAVRGSREARFLPALSNNPVAGPVVDGVAPSAAYDVFGYDLETGEQEEGVFKMEWKWPEENTGFQETESNGKVSKLIMALRRGEGNVLTEDNWNETGKDEDGLTVIYRNFTRDNEIGDPYSRTADYFVGRKDDSVMNPDDVFLEKMTIYNVAFRAVDEEGNWGPVSENLEVETWWRRPDRQGIESISVSDYMGIDGNGDNGGALNVTWVPINILHPEDIVYFWIFINDEPFSTVSELGRSQPDYNITREFEYESFLDRWYAVKEFYKDGVKTSLKDGSSYYVAVVPVNWLGQYIDEVILSQKIKVINNKANPIPLIEGVQGENYGTGGDKISLTWEKTNDQRFVEYQIWGAPYYFDELQDAYFISNITDKDTNSKIIEDISGTKISQEKEYTFAVLVLDYNDKIDETLDPEKNMAINVKTFADPPLIMDQVKGVTLKDRGNDGGGVLQLSWFNLISRGTFWQYNIYFSDEPIVDVTKMDSVHEITSHGVEGIEIDSFEGRPLIDGKMYYAAVTMVSYDLAENTQLDQNNVDSAEPINQSDTTPPGMIVNNFHHDPSTITFNSFNVSWMAVTESEVQDFQYYWIRWSGPKNGQAEVRNRDATEFTITGLDRGKEYWVNITMVDDAGNIGPTTSSFSVMTAGQNEPPEIDNVTVNANEVDYVRDEGNTDLIQLSEDDTRSEVIFTVYAHDDYTNLNNLKVSWNITTPSGTNIEKTLFSFIQELSETGIYEITVVVTDDEGLSSDPFSFSIEVQKKDEGGANLGLILIPIFVVVVLIALGVVLFVVFSSRKSQQKQMLEQYEDRRKDIETMEPIYTDIPTWTCDCGSTTVQINENAYCASCYQSHEAVPINAIDQYLKDHELVLTEMKIDIPRGWQGQDLAIDNAKKDLAERKERALNALNQEFAMWLRGTEYESEIPKEETPEEQAEAQGGQPPLVPQGAIIPGQMPPPSPSQPTPLTPQPMQAQAMGARPPAMGQPMQPMPMRPPLPGQPQPMRPPGQPMPQPARPPMPGQPQQQRPPYPPQQH
ncbi:MAG: FG-GAP-like repeat-containing protein [Thermoplasmatota archaeon]